MVCNLDSVLECSCIDRPSRADVVRMSLGVIVTSGLCALPFPPNGPGSSPVLRSD